MGMISEFKEFAVKGNMLDMAVGIIMGGAFGTIIKSLVEDVLMPPIGMLMNGVDFSSLKFVLQGADEAAGKAEVAIGYGNFFNALIAFLIVAFVLFRIIKGMNKFKKAEEEAPSAPPANEVLLAEIRDLLKK